MVEVVLANESLEMTAIKLEHALVGLVERHEVKVGRGTPEGGPEGLIDLAELGGVPLGVGAALRWSKEELKKYCANIENDK